MVEQTKYETMQRLLLMFLIFCYYHSFSQSLTYIYPKPNTDKHSIQTPIILRYDRAIDLNGHPISIEIIGEKSGKHSFDFQISSDRRTVSIQTHQPFALDENVNVDVNGNNFSFRTSKISPQEQKKLFVQHFLQSFPEISNAIFGTVSKEINDIPLDSIPSDFPKIIINSVRNPAPGYIYLANFGGGVDRSYLMILNNDGTPVKYRKVPLPGFDFKMQPNGLITNARIITSHIPQGWGWAEAYMEVMDGNLKVIDTVQCKGGYIADFHDFKILPNGHYLLISYDPQPVDMSQIIPNGNPNAIVLGSIVQELDIDKNVVFQWRSWDHIPITDTYAPLDGIALDPVHINAVELDYDGHLLISSRHTSEITKINRETGEIIWRLGGKKNQFTFINEHPENAPTYFSYQHDIRRLPNGNITLYDNGVQHDPKYSRAVEYKLDEENLTAELVWEYRNNPDVYGETMGSTQRLPNGNTVIGWGGVTTGHIRIVTEVNPAGEIEFELSFPKGVTFQITSYRAYRYPYPTNLPEAIVTFENISSLIQNPGDSLSFKNDTTDTGIIISFNELNDQPGSKITLEKYPYAPLYPRFTSPAPLVNQYKVLIKTQNITKCKANLIFDISKFPLSLHKKDLIVWRRLSENFPFEPLQCSYDPENKLLVAIVDNLDGEYIFGTPASLLPPSKPILTFPPDNAKLNTEDPVVFQWTPQGITKFSKLVISKNIDFTEITEIDSIKTNQFNAGKLPAGDYFWKVQTFNEVGVSEWSEVHSFNISEPFISIFYPDSGATWIKETKVWIVWQHNIYPAFEITLFKESSPLMNIADSIYSTFGKYIWDVSNLVPPGNDYKIRITSLKNKRIFAESKTFSISEPSSVEDISNSIVISPNPCDGNLNVKLNGLEVQQVDVFNFYGIRVYHHLFTNYDSTIRLNLSYLPDGLYLLAFRTNNGIHKMPFIILKN